MKIQGPGWIGRSNPYQKQEQINRDVSQAKGKRDQLQISTEALEMLRGLESPQGTQSPEREERIAQLKTEVQSGTYKVDAGKVAEKLIEWWNPSK